MTSENYITLHEFPGGGRVKEHTAGTDGFLLQTRGEVWLVRDEQRIRADMSGDISMGEHPLVLRSCGLSQLSSTGDVRRNNDSFAGADEVVCALDEGTAVVRDGSRLRYCDANTLLEINSRKIHQSISSENLTCFVGGFNAVAIAEGRKAAWYPTASDLPGFRVQLENKITDLGFLNQHLLVSTKEYIVAYEPTKDESAWGATAQWKVPSSHDWLANRGRDYIVAGGRNNSLVYLDGEIKNLDSNRIISETPNHSRRLELNRSRFTVKQKSELLSVTVDAPESIRAHASETVRIELENKDETLRRGKLEVKFENGSLIIPEETDISAHSTGQDTVLVSYRLDSEETQCIELRGKSTTPGQQGIVAKTEEVKIREPVHVAPAMANLSVEFGDVEKHSESEYFTQMEVINNSPFPVKLPMAVKLDGHDLCQIPRIDSEDRVIKKVDVPSNTNQNPTVEIIYTDRSETVLEEDVSLTYPRPEIDASVDIERLTKDSVVLSVVVSNTGDETIKHVSIESWQENESRDGSSGGSLDRTCPTRQVIEGDEEISLSHPVDHRPGSKLRWKVTAQNEAGGAMKKGEQKLPANLHSLEIERLEDTPGIRSFVSAEECAIRSSHTVRVPEFDIEESVELSLSEGDSHTMTVVFPEYPTTEFEVEASVTGSKSMERTLEEYPPITVDRLVTPEQVDASVLESTNESWAGCETANILSESLVITNRSKRPVESISLSSPEGGEHICEANDELSSGDSLRFKRQFCTSDDSVKLDEHIIEADASKTTVPATEYEIHRSDISISGEISLEADDVILKLSIENRADLQFSISGITMDNPPAIWANSDNALSLAEGESMTIRKSLTDSVLGEEKLSELMRPEPTRVSVTGSLHTIPISFDTMVSFSISEKVVPPVEISRTTGRDPVKILLQNNFPTPVRVEQIKIVSESFETLAEDSFILNNNNEIEITGTPKAYELVIELNTFIGPASVVYSVKREHSILGYKTRYETDRVVLPEFPSSETMFCCWKYSDLD